MQREGTQSVDLTLTPIASLGEAPEPLSVLIVHEKDSQSSLKAVTCMGVVSHGERTQLKSGHEQTRRRPGESRCGASVVPSPWSYGGIGLPAPT